MCGITGIFAFNQIGSFYMINLSKAVDILSKRGPDTKGTFVDDLIGLGHRRLSIIDTSSNGRQPMSDETGRYTMVFNGEIFNYKELKEKLEQAGINFRTETDSEVLLQHYITYGRDGLQDLIGFFAFAVYDKNEKSIFIARDRMGIKPLVYYCDEDKFIFASEIKSLLQYNIPKSLDYTSLYEYFHFNYIPSPNSIFKSVKKLEPGHFLYVKDKELENKAYYTIDYTPGRYSKGDYESQKKQLTELLDESVRIRMVSDVPLGAFLSGGIDSSVITALASRYTDKLHTFSIGYKDEPFFDETQYARLVAKKYNTEHTVFKLSNDDLFDHLDDMFQYLDEPFADSSALAVNILSRYTAKDVKVALSGDGADELFAGYSKHMGEYKVRNGGLVAQWIKNLLPVWKAMPQSRNAMFGNKMRQLVKFAEGSQMAMKDRYYNWAGFTNQEQLSKLFSPSILENINRQEHQERKQHILRFINENGDLNDVLRTDVDLVLVSDMLHKVDMMSMANGLEVRVPFLDHRVVDFAFSLPEESKINHKMKKRIVQDAFRELLPKELYGRPKHGFEVPLHKWFKRELKTLINDDLLGKDFINEQDVFNWVEINDLKRKVFSNNPGDSVARVWGLLVFQYWWKKYFC
ncbi:MAG: asparagine synthase (glutamine-hydrolyzing) [Cytophagaceae bacterium]